MAVMSGPLLLPVPMHLGTLHGYEQALVLVLAFGPFVVLAVVVAVVRRRDLAAEGEDSPGGSASGDDPAQRER